MEKGDISIGLTPKSRDQLLMYLYTEVRVLMRMLIPVYAQAQEISGEEAVKEMKELMGEEFQDTIRLVAQIGNIDVQGFDPQPPP